MKIERHDRIVITVEGEEVPRLVNFLKNAVRMGYTSDFDEAVVKQITAAVEAK